MDQSQQQNIPEDLNLYVSLHYDTNFKYLGCDISYQQHKQHNMKLSKCIPNK